MVSRQRELVNLPQPRGTALPYELSRLSVPDVRRVPGLPSGSPKRERAGHVIDISGARCVGASY
jgi:hypothetical protein